MSKKINNRFNKDYTQYWQKVVNVSKDKISIPDELNVSYWLKKLNLYNFNNTLDLGCSYGRLFECLKKISKDVSGCDPEKYAIELAKKKKYYEVRIGSAEETSFPSNNFDFVFSWGVFDTVNLNLALLELNRISKKFVLFTGKNNFYSNVDLPALVAERNAFLKGHQNKFTNINLLIKVIEKFGFRISKLILFPLRGDWARNIYIEWDVCDSSPIEGYEYLIVLEKTADVFHLANKIESLWSPFSETMNELAKKHNFDDCISLFKSNNFEKIIKN